MQMFTKYSQCLELCVHVWTLLHVNIGPGDCGRGVVGGQGFCRVGGKVGLAGHRGQGFVEALMYCLIVPLPVKYSYRALQMTPDYLLKFWM